VHAMQPKGLSIGRVANAFFLFCLSMLVWVYVYGNVSCISDLLYGQTNVKLLFVAECCSALQHVLAVCGSVFLQCVAVCYCSVLQRVAVY